MKLIFFKKTAIEITIKSMIEPPSNWKTFNDRLNTTIFYNTDQILNTKIELKKQELPVLECVLQNNYTIITTERILSKFDGKSYEISLIEVTGLSNRFEKTNHCLMNDIPAKTNIVEVLGENRQSLIFEIDSFHPTYFSKLIILNLSCYIRNGKWYLNPKKDYQQTLRRWKK